MDIFKVLIDFFNPINISFIRLNAAFWSERIEQALETLGGMAEALA